jgi:uncharacterized protein DUF2721
VPPDTGITAVAHAIQLAVAPVFLLSGVAGLLAVLTNRLARVIDRSRALAAPIATHAPDTAAVQGERQTLARRAKFISRAIALCTISALLICAVIATLFVGAFARFDASVPVALLFVAAMVALFVGLLAFLREVFLATANLRSDPH